MGVEVFWEAVFTKAGCRPWRTESNLRDDGDAVDGYGRDRGEKATRLSLAMPQHQGVWACLRTDVQCLQSVYGAWVWWGGKFRISAL